LQLKDESELAHVLGMAFTSYANKVQNGLVQPYLTFLEGEESVNVKVTLNQPGVITVEKIVEETSQAEEPAAESTGETVDFSMLPTVKPTKKKKRRRAT